MKRQSLSKKVRFEVFKRDSFTCQYCGKKAPEVILAVDHIEPVAKGGSDDMLNLITSCFDCNSGKSDRTLDDTTVLHKQHKQLAELQERRQQIEMMFEWQKSLMSLDDQIVEELSLFWHERVDPFSLNANGRRELKKLSKRYSIDELMEAIEAAVTQYVEYDQDDVPTLESVEHAWRKVGSICSIRQAEKEKPYLPDLFYIRGILRNRLSYVNDWMAKKLLEDAFILGASAEQLKEDAKHVRNWTEWRESIERFVRERTSDSGK